MTPEELMIISKGEREFLIYGPASVEVVDDEKEKIDVAALKASLPQLLRRHAISYRIHKDIIVGEILERRVVDGQVYKTEVLNDTLYVLANIFGDDETSRKTRQEIESGVLKAYSISGRELASNLEWTEDAKLYKNITKLDLFAVCVCEKGINPEARFEVISKAEAVEKKVEQRGSQWCVIHCHGEEAGKPIKCFPTEAQAQAMHRAIQARKHASKVGELSGAEYDEIEAEVVKGPPAECVEAVKEIVTGIGDEECVTLAGQAWLDQDALVEKQHPTRYGEAWKGPSPTGEGRPDPAWMDRCAAKAGGFARNPYGFCNALWYYGAAKFQKSFAGSVHPTQPGGQGGSVESGLRGELPDIGGDLLRTLRTALGGFLSGWFGRSRGYGHGEMRMIEKQDDGRPPKDWWDTCIRTVTEGGSAQDPAAVCGHIWYEMGVRKPVKSADVETAIEKKPSLGKAGKEAGKMPDPEQPTGKQEGEQPATLEDVAKELAALREAIAALPAQLTAELGKQFPPKKEGEEDDEERRRREEEEKRQAEKGPVEKLKETIDKMPEKERAEFLTKTGLQEVKPDPDKFKKELADLSAEDRKVFLEKAGFVVTETPRPAGAQAEPTIGQQTGTDYLELVKGKSWDEVEALDAQLRKKQKEKEA